jgi:biotin synthase
MAHSPQKNTIDTLSKHIRASLGTAITLKLLKGKLDASPTTAYLMTYKRGKCNANCGFCPQAKKSHGRADLLSRVSWPIFPTSKLIKGLTDAVERGEIKRACIQALNYPEVFQHLIALVKTISKETKVLISVSCQPLNVENIKRLAVAGVERIGIPLDAATPQLFEKIKGASAGGPYDWQSQWRLLEEAVSIFDKGRVSTHFIVGLGETEKDLVEALQKCVDMGVLPALFAFTPIAGTLLYEKTQPLIETYRRVQLARYLIMNGTARLENLRFDDDERLIDFGISQKTLAETVQTGKPFRTSGCPNCNRPYYNEKPSGPLYNYPRDLTGEEICEVQNVLGLKRGAKH